MMRASKSLMVGWWWGGLFDYSVSPGPFLDFELDLELDNFVKVYVIMEIRQLLSHSWLRKS